MRRRAFLLAGGVTGLATLAGCATGGAGDREGVVLTHVELGNGTEAAQRFDVQVVDGDGIVHWSVYEVPAGQDEMGDRVVALDLPPEPKRITVNVRVDEHWETLDFDDHVEYDGERVIAIVTFGMIDEELRVRPHGADRTPSEPG